MTDDLADDSSGTSLWRRGMMSQNKTATVVDIPAMPNSTGGYPNRVNNMPAPAVAAEAASALQKSVIAAAVLRSGSGVSFISRL
jgi:hypothetical protein